MSESGKALVCTPPFEEEGMITMQIDVEDMEEAYALKTLRAMLLQMLHAVDTCLKSTNAGLYNQFNKDKFVRNNCVMMKFVAREFPPKRDTDCQ